MASGHNAVAFFLTQPIVGLMYYFLPKAANQPVYSYRLSVIHFWSLIFIYIWAGPHHLLYSSAADWAQTLGMIFSIALIAPSWGGMINGLLTLRGKWNEVRTNPILKMMALSVTFYGMSTLEGPLLSIKSVNYLAHFTDWVPGHVHSGTLGWNAFLIAAMLYWMVPKLWKTELHSLKWANWHFWIGTIGIILYIVSMWTAGITQGLMWRALNPEGYLVYPDFVETVTTILSMYYVRTVAGILFLAGFILMTVNLIKTIQAAPKNVEEEVFKAPPLVHSKYKDESTGHRKLEGMATVFVVLSLLAIVVGTLVELLPAMFSDEFFEKNPKVKPYTALELAGRDIYIAEGCYTCHSQQIRHAAQEEIRYGKISEAADSMYDRPFQWGSRRIGPDLAREGGNYPDLWHYRHMIDPREVTPGSIMPVYTWLIEKDADLEILSKKLSVMQFLGVPYTDEQISSAVADAKKQAMKIAKNLNQEGNIPLEVKDKQIIALIAYLQRLGVDTEDEE
jgi:cytochrome c oxidase cbb3-type subunit I/II